MLHAILAAKSRCSIGIEFAPINGATGMQRAILSMGFTYGANDGTVSTAIAARARVAWSEANYRG